MTLEAAIFDLFGTLCERTSPEREIMGMQDLGPEKHDELQRAICGQVFMGWNNYLEKIVKVAGMEMSDNSKEIVKEIIAKHFRKGLETVYPSSKPVFSGLKAKGYRLGLVSNCFPPCREILEKTGLEKFFEKEAVVLSFEAGITKQSPEIYRLCLKRLGVSPGKAVMVGDNRGKRYNYGKSRNRRQNQRRFNFVGKGRRERGLRDCFKIGGST